MTRVDLGRVVDLAARLEADAALDPETLRHRDRPLGRRLAAGLDDLSARLAAWLDDVREDPGPTTGERVQRAQRLLRALLTGLGLGLGALTAAAVFAYDGTHPVNVVQVLAVFVALQLATLVATGLIALPEGWRRGVPGLAALQDVLRLASPGRWLPALRRLLEAEQREAFDRAAGLLRRHRRLYGDAQKWTLLVASQHFAVAFHVAALLTAIGLVTFSDLAFGWSTTLDVEAATLHRVAVGLATPWAPLWPDAVPTAELIAETRFFRGAGGDAMDAERSAAWWRFLLACMACYGLAPRLALWAWARWREGSAWRRALASLPGVAELRDRLDSRWVETTASEAEAAAVPPPAPARGGVAPRPARVHAVRWSGIGIADAEVAALTSSTLGAELAGVVDGGAGADRDDASLVAELARGDASPLFLVKSWEPPLLELADLLGELRDACGDRRPILVMPLARGEAGSLEPADDDGARTWARRLDAVGDPWLDVVTGAAA